jgi:hypothetical protein
MRRRLFTLAAGTVAAAVLCAAVCVLWVRAHWQRDGDVITSGQGSRAVAGGELATFMGNEQRDDVVGPGVPYLYVFILTPDGSTADGGSGSSGTPTPWMMSETFQYAYSAASPGAPRRFTIGFDGRRRIATFGGREYSLDRGDFFVVRLDANWNPSVEQGHRDLADVSLSDTVKQQLRPNIILHASPGPVQ